MFGWCQFSYLQQELATTTIPTKFVSCRPVMCIEVTVPPNLTKNVTKLVLVLVPSQLLSSPLSKRESDFPPPVDPSCFPGLCCRYCINLPSLFPLAGMPRAIRHPCPMRRHIDTPPEGGRFPHSCEILLPSPWLGPTGDKLRFIA